MGIFVKKPKKVWYKFWIKSSRGTDEVAFYQLEDGLDNEIIKEWCEDWCRDFGAWNVSESFCRYGWERIKFKMPTLATARIKDNKIAATQLLNEIEFKKLLVPSSSSDAMIRNRKTSQRLRAMRNRTRAIVVALTRLKVNSQC